MDPNRKSLGPPPNEPEKPPEQLAITYAAMMEELGNARLDTLPLEDRGHEGHIPLTLAHQKRARRHVSAGVAAWQNFDPGDVPEARQGLDSIADGQLARSRRGPPSGTNQSPPGRGNHSSNRGGHSSNNSLRGGRGGGPPKGSPNRGGRGGGRVLASSLPRGRGDQNASSAHGHLDYTSTPAHFNDGRRGGNHHGQIQKAIEILRGPTSAAPRGRENRPPAVSSSSRFAVDALNDPNAFLSSKGLLLERSGNARPTAPNTSQPAVKATSLRNSQPIREGAGTTAASKVSQPPTKSAVNSFPLIVQSATPIFANRSTGLASSMYAVPQPAQAPPSRMSTTSSARSSDPTYGTFAITQATLVNNLAAVSTPAPALGNSNILRNSNASANSFIAAPLSAHPSDTKSAASQASTAAGRVILYDRAGAKASMNGAAQIEGKFKIYKTSKSIILELVALKNNNFHKSYEVQWRQSLAECKFSLSKFVKEMVFTIGSDTFSVEFQFPHDRDAVEKILQSHLQAPALRNASAIPAPASEAKSLIREYANTNEASHSDEPVNLFDEIAKVHLNGAGVIDGKVRLLKIIGALVLEAWSTKDRESYDLQWAQSLSGTVTFSIASNHTEMTIVIGSDTCVIRFRLPHHAAQLEKLLQSHLGEASSVSDQLSAKTTDEKRKPATDEQNRKLREAEREMERKRAIVKTLSVLSASDSEHPLDFENKNPGLADFNLHIPGSFPTDDSLLIDFSEETPGERSLPATGNSEADNLLSLDGDYFVVETMLDALNNAAGKSFLDSNRETSAEELTAIVESFTSSRLNVSKAFRTGLSPTARVAFVKEIAKRTLEMALLQDQQAIFASERSSTPRGEDPVDGSSYYGDLSIGDDYSLQVNDHEEVSQSQQKYNSGQDGESQYANESVHASSMPRKYPVRELVGLRSRASTLDIKLPQPETASKLEKLEEERSSRRSSMRQTTSDYQSPKDQPQRPSKEELASKFASPDVKRIFQGQDSSESALQNLILSVMEQQQSQVTIEAAAPTTLQQQTARTPNGSVASAMTNVEPSTVKPKGSQHRLAESRDLTQLATVFSGLKIAPAKPTSAPLFDNPKEVSDTSNLKVEEKKGHGLSSSRWSSNPHPPTQAAQSVSGTTPHYHTVSGLEVIGTVPVVAHQLVMPATYHESAVPQQFPQHPNHMSAPVNQENYVSQGFPPRSDMFNRNVSGSSTASKSYFFTAPSSPPNKSQPGLANIQAAFQDEDQQTPTNRRT